MNPLLQVWSQQFTATHPSVRFEIQASGSSTAAIALSEGTTDIGPMSRLFTTLEMQRFSNQGKSVPQAIAVAMDALAVFVHRKNPLHHISISQLDSIFSATRLCGSHHAIENWQQLDKSFSSQAIRAHGRNSVSGSYALFRERALCNGDFAPDISVQMGSGSIVRLVGIDRWAMGYAPIGFNSPFVKPLAIGTDQNAAVLPTSQTIAQQQYPLGRMLYIAIPAEPDRPLPETQIAFLRFILSPQGQQLVEQTGFVPLSPEQLSSALENISQR